MIMWSSRSEMNRILKYDHSVLVIWGLVGGSGGVWVHLWCFWELKKNHTNTKTCSTLVNDIFVSNLTHNYFKALGKRMLYAFAFYM